MKFPETISAILCAAFCALCAETLATPPVQPIPWPDWIDSRGMVKNPTPENRERKKEFVRQWWKNECAKREKAKKHPRIVNGRKCRNKQEAEDARK